MNQTCRFWLNCGKQWTFKFQRRPTRTALKKLLLKHRQAFSQHDDDIGFNYITQHKVNPGNKRPVLQPLRRQTSTEIYNKIVKPNTAGTCPCTRQKFTCSADSVSLLPSAYDDNMVSTVQSNCCRVEAKVSVYDPCQAATAACPPVVSRELHRAPSVPQVLPVVFPDDHRNFCSTSRCEASRPRRNHRMFTELRAICLCLGSHLVLKSLNYGEFFP